MGPKCLTVPATLGSLSDIASFVKEAAAAAGLDRRAAYNLRLAVDEFATNVVTHGDPGAGPGQIDLRAEADDHTLTVSIEDTGPPFDPREAPPPEDLHLPAEQRRVGGLGIFLALQAVDHFDYERVGGRNRNVLVMNRPGAHTQRS
jgi:anti-sigma regulatory factor (Ser/Thr protein kinase)